MSNTDDFAFNFEDVDNTLSFDEPEVVIEKTAVLIEELAEEVREESQEAPADTGPTKAEKAEFLTIYDSIMFEDKFEKTYPLGTKYKATFATRSADADMTISRQLDNMKFSTMHAFQTMSAVLTMSHSLTHLNGKDLSSMSVSERYNFIRTKSSHLIELLADRMIKFDHLVRSALEYGEENF